MSTITSIATCVPGFKYSQNELCSFAEKIYTRAPTDARKIRFLYAHSGIEERYSVIPDFNKEPKDYSFFSPTENLEPDTSVEKRMEWYEREALKISKAAVLDCMEGKIKVEDITHLITVSCTGMSAPGLDLQLMETLNLPKNIVRTSVNFMGCYAAIHAMKLADAFCRSEKNANVLVVCTELCTIHFQKEPTQDNITSSLLFSDGCAAMLIQSQPKEKGIRINSFYSELFEEGKKDMSWNIASNGFQMTLSPQIPHFIKLHFADVVQNALKRIQTNTEKITSWCVHPGGKKILETVSESMHLQNDALENSYDILKNYGNMSSATIVFVLKKLLDKKEISPLIFGAAFGPGLTIETFTASYD